MQYREKKKKSDETDGDANDNLYLFQIVGIEDSIIIY